MSAAAAECSLICRLIMRVSERTAEKREKRRKEEEEEEKEKEKSSRESLWSLGMARSFLSICAVSEQVNGRPDSRTFSTSSVVHFHWWQLVFSGKIVYIFVTTFCRLLTTLGVFSANRLSFVLDAKQNGCRLFTIENHTWNDNNTVLPYANWKLSSEYSCLINANCEEFDKFGNTS